MTIEEIKELYINKESEADWKAEVWSKDLFGINTSGETFWSIAIDYVGDLIKLLGHTENYDKLSIDEIEKILNDYEQIQEMLNKVNSNEFTKLREILTLNENVKGMLYQYIINKTTQKKLENQKHEKVSVKVNEASMIDTLHNNDYIEINLFNELKKVQVFSTGDNRFDANGNYKEDNFELNEEEINYLKWFLKNVDIEDYKAEIVNYCNDIYSDWSDIKISEQDVEKEIDIFAIAISITNKVYDGYVFPDISFYGSCNCDEDHGICIGFKDKQFLGVKSQDWIL